MNDTIAQELADLSRTCSQKHKLAAEALTNMFNKRLSEARAALSMAPDEVRPGAPAAPTMDTLPPRGACSICLDNPSTYAMVPCGHLCMCLECCNKLRSIPRGANHCPICRTASTQVLKIHDTGPPVEPAVATLPPPADDQGTVWYAPVRIGGREFLRDTQDRVYDIDQPDVVVGYWNAKYICEYGCGFVGSFESCTRHEQLCATTDWIS